jgi:predicted aspartyl protease
MQRRLESAHFPFIPLRLSIGLTTVDIDALVDTGFDGDIALPASFPRFDRQPTFESRWILTDGSQVIAPGYQGSALIDSIGTFAVAVTMIGNEPLVGVGFVRRILLTLDHGERVIVGP